MKVLEMLDEIEEIVDTASGFPLTGKIMVDSTELLELVRDIRNSLPDEIQQAQWIRNERDRILDEAKNEYETIIRDAENRAEHLVAENVIMEHARTQADDLMRTTEENIRTLKMSTYDYVDSILFKFQERMGEMQEAYFADMFNRLEKTFEDVNATLAENRDEIKEMAYRTTMNLDEVPASSDMLDDGKDATETEDYEDYQEEDR